MNQKKESKAKFLIDLLEKGKEIAKSSKDPNYCKKIKEKANF